MVQCLGWVHPALQEEASEAREDPGTRDDAPRCFVDRPVLSPTKATKKLLSNLQTLQKELKPHCRADENEIDLSDLYLPASTHDQKNIVRD